MLGLLLLCLTALASDVSWQEQWDKAFELAKKERRPVLIAINMDGERANDAVLKLYQDKKVVRASKQCVCLIASIFNHAEKGKCPRFGQITCEQHRAIEQRTRKLLLKAKVIKDITDPVNAPQHILVDPFTGKILERKEFLLTAKDLRGMIVQAVRLMKKKK